MYCKTGKNQRLNPNVLRREAFLVVFLTLFGLFLGAVLGSTCVIILKLNGFNYYPASFGKKVFKRISNEFKINFSIFRKPEE